MGIANEVWVLRVHYIQARGNPLSDSDKSKGSVWKHGRIRLRIESPSDSWIEHERCLEQIVKDLYCRGRKRSRTDTQDPHAGNNYNAPAGTRYQTSVQIQKVAVVGLDRCGLLNRESRAVQDQLTVCVVKAQLHRHWTRWNRAVGIR